MTQRDNDFAYDDRFVALAELLWGKGFLSGDSSSLARMFRGIDTDGRHVLDIGSGLGGADIVLARDWGARTVTGLEVSAELVAKAVQRAKTAGLSEKISYRCVAPGPIPLPDRSVDIAFTKGVLIHIVDEHEFFAEVYRVLCPGGIYVSQDWAAGEARDSGAHLGQLRQLFGADLILESLGVRHDALVAAGFVDIEIEDQEDATVAVQREHTRMVDELKRELIKLLGAERYARECQLWRMTAEALRDGGLVACTLRACKPR